MYVGACIACSIISVFVNPGKGGTCSCLSLFVSIISLIILALRIAQRATGFRQKLALKNYFKLTKWAFTFHTLRCRLEDPEFIAQCGLPDQTSIMGQGDWASVVEILLNGMVE